MSIKKYVYKIKTSTKKEIFLKLLKKIKNFNQKLKYTNFDVRTIDIKININYNYIYLNIFKEDNIQLKELEHIINNYLQHNFDILGSGWINIGYNYKSVGLEGYRYNSNIKYDKSYNDLIKDILLSQHLTFSKKFGKIISKKYVPIDWQLDFKSGYRYDSKKWCKHQRKTVNLGADIKVPWELARMQYLPQMAIGAVILKDYKENILLEFKNIVLDFLTANPPNMGCNWACTMDVAIRISNILLAYDVLKQIDNNNILDYNFQNILSNATYEHGKFIINNLEWSKNGIKGNHYFSDIVGLLFVASYLNRTDEIDAWLAFSVQEIIECVKTQFHEDGSNFEASTTYHRLSGELMVYSTALIYGVLSTDKKEALNKYNNKLIKRLKKIEQQEYNITNKEFFPNWYINRLFNSACFTQDLTKLNDKVPQIGDNDSGRFIKLSPTGYFTTWKEAYNKYYNLKNHIEKVNVNEIYWDEDILNHKTYISLVDGLFDYAEFREFSREYPLEKYFIENLSKGMKLKSDKNYKTIKLESIIKKDTYINKVTEIKFEDYGLGNIKIEDIKLLSYPDFGIYIFKSKEIHLTIMAGHNGQNGNGGHTHNDKLSFELNIKGRDLFVDPGTYLYTPIPKIRDKFRSIQVHNVPIVNEEEQNTFLSAFSMKDETNCNILNYSNNSIEIYLTYRDIKIIREFNIHEDKICIKDSCNKDFRVNMNNRLYSNGYGKLLNSDCLI